ncbi:hypothetical protein B0H16DRAFT_1717785 [Mycena metata]|uniref:Uncharacterized protein n=1 Tax=Mycena metata TaxID=1033252 RepID=A0AAD7JLW0_9AGAR|nr:hypothetical protein B0H16DRAFT_1717785 [Mycena metata]
MPMETISLSYASFSCSCALLSTAQAVFSFSFSYQPIFVLLWPYLFWWDSDAAPELLVADHAELSGIRDRCQLEKKARPGAEPRGKDGSKSDNASGNTISSVQLEHPENVSRVACGVAPLPSRPLPACR